MSEKIVLSPHQEAAVRSKEPKLVVRASAGAGKTRVLVERYVRHVIEDGIRPDQMLTVTFTRKAAAEMKKRITDSLRSAGRWDEAQVAETGPIQTLHSFCERLLRENAVAAGIDPDFAMLSEAEATQFLNQAMREAIADTPKANPAARAFLRKVAGERAFGAVSAHGQLEKLFKGAMFGLRGTLVTPQQVRENHRSPEAVLRAWREGMAIEIEEAIRPTDLLNPAFWQAVREAAKREKLKLPGFAPTQSNAAKADLDEPVAAEDTCGLMALVADAWERLEARMVREQRFDFTFLEARAVALMPLVADRLREQFRVALVDEAQDLNPVQYRLLAALPVETEMAVGDAQQSIYGFRQADVRLFEARQKQLPTADLPRNYRSTQPVLKFVDRLFGRLWPAYQPMAEPEALEDYAGVELWVAGKKTHGPVVEWLAEVSKQEGPENVAVLVRMNAEATALQSRLEAAGVPARISGGGEKFYTRLEVRDLVNLLRALTDPRDDLALLASLRGPACKLSLASIARLAREPGVAGHWTETELSNDDDARKLATFRAWFESVSPIADRLSGWEAVNEVFTNTPFLENLAVWPNARQAIANVRKLLMLAAERPELNAREFADDVRQIQELVHREGEAPSVDDLSPAVTIMTVHKAKGLEFDVVVVTGLDVRQARSAQPIELDRDAGLAVAKLGATQLPAQKWLADRRRDGEAAEQLRNLYVALTRAKRRLCVVVDDGADQTLLSGRVWNVLDPVNDPMPNLKIRRGAVSGDV